MVNIYLRNLNIIDVESFIQRELHNAATHTHLCYHAHHESLNFTTYDPIQIWTQNLLEYSAWKNNSTICSIKHIVIRIAEIFVWIIKIYMAPQVALLVEDVIISRIREPSYRMFYLKTDSKISMNVRFLQLGFLKNRLIGITPVQSLMWIRCWNPLVMVNIFSFQNVRDDNVLRISTYGKQSAIVTSEPQ